MATPHIQAERGDFAETVLMPGDPLRARFVAENYLEDARRVTSVRNVFGYTGTYRGTKLSVMASGMGVPSIGIYSYELYHFFGVEQIIRIGSAGGIAPEVRVGDIVLAQAASTDSNFALQYGLPGTFAPIADFGLLTRAAETAHRLDIPLHVGNVLTTDVFYKPLEACERWREMGILCTEMESAGLYCNAAAAHKRALSILTISDLPFEGVSTSAEEREKGFGTMMELALEAVRGA